MDLAYLLGRHQISLHRASVAATPEARLAHRGLAAGYAGRLRNCQLDLHAGSALAQLS